MMLPNLIIIGVDPGFVPSIWRTTRSLRHTLCRCISDGVRARLRDWAEVPVHRPAILDTDPKSELTKHYFRDDIRCPETMLDRGLAHWRPA